MRIKALLFTPAILAASVLPANAISWSVQMNCASDYYAYCSKHVAGSAGCHACMNTNRSKLSTACVSALIDDGIIPKTDVTQQKTKLAVSKARPAQSARPMPDAKPATKPPKAKFATLKRRPKVATFAASAALPPPKPVQAALVIDQQTFEAFKNRAPYFVSAAEEATASIAAPD